MYLRITLTVGCISIELPCEVFELLRLKIEKILSDDYQYKISKNVIYVFGSHDMLYYLLYKLTNSFKVILY